MHQEEGKEGGFTMTSNKLAKKEDTLITPWHRLLDDVFDMRPLFEWRPELEVPGFGGDWVPAIDLAETSGEYLLRAEMAGMKKEDVKISIAQNVLTLSGEKKAEWKGEDKKVHRVERAYGTFRRSFSLPGPVKADDITAVFKDGILEVRIPKSEEAKAKRIDIQAE